MTRAESFMEREKCKNIQCSSVTNSAWCGLNKKGNILKLHEKCLNSKRNFQKKKTFTLHQYMLE